jgi:zinc transport system substrate-binding protein
MASDVDLRRLLTFAALLVLLCGCPSKSAKEQPSDPKPFTVVAVNYPLAYFAERISPTGTEVVLPAPPNVDPAHWQPSPEAIVGFQNADVILLNGAGFERWTQTATLPRTGTVVTADRCRDAFLTGQTTSAHRHGPEGEHSHTGTAFTTWLDLGLAACQAEHVRDALLGKLPDRSSVIRKESGNLANDLATLDASMQEAAASLGDAPVFASHPVYQYLGDAYGLDIYSFHFEPDEELDAEGLAAVDAARKTHPAALMLWEAEPLPGTRRSLEDRGIQVVVFDPAANRPSEGDFLDVMRENVQRFECAAKPEGCR